MEKIGITKETLQLLTTGQALFETILFEDGILWFWDEHMERLAKSLKQFNVSIKRDRIKSRVLEQLAGEGRGNAARVKIVAACSFRTNRTTQALEDDSIIILSSALPDTIKNRSGHTLHTRNWPYGDEITYTAHKTINFGLNFFSIFQSDDKTDDILYVNRDQQIMETTVANIFCYRKDEFYTPPATLPILPGIIRHKIIEHFNVLEAPVFLSNLRENDLLFSTNSVREICFINSIDDRHFRINEHRRKQILQKWYQIKEQYKESEASK